ncbi:MAG: hypothetical protein DRO05_02665, partial [Thermoproteota archaeon]
VLEVKDVKSVSLPSSISITVPQGEIASVSVTASSSWPEYVELFKASSFPDWVQFSNVTLAPYESRPVFFTFNAKGRSPGPWKGTIYIGAITEGGHYEEHPINVTMMVNSSSGSSQPGSSGSKLLAFIHVVELDTLKPIPNAYIVVDNSIPGQTDANGTATFLLPAGTHTIRIAKTGYQDFSKYFDLAQDKQHFTFYMLRLTQQNSSSTQPQSNGSIPLASVQLMWTRKEIEVERDEETVVRNIVFPSGGVCELQMIAVADEPVWIIASQPMPKKIASPEYSQHGEGYAVIEIRVVALEVEPGTYEKSFVLIGARNTNITFTLVVNVRASSGNSNSSSYPYAYGEPVAVVKLSSGVSIEPGFHNVVEHEIITVDVPNSPNLIIATTGQIAPHSSPVILGPRKIMEFMINGDCTLTIKWRETSYNLQTGQLEVRNSTSYQGFGTYQFKVSREVQKRAKWKIKVKFEKAVYYAGEIIEFKAVNKTGTLELDWNGEMKLIPVGRQEAEETNITLPIPIPRLEPIEVDFDNDGEATKQILAAGVYKVVPPTGIPFESSFPMITVLPRVLDPYEIDYKVHLDEKTFIPATKGVRIRYAILEEGRVEDFEYDEKGVSFIIRGVRDINITVVGILGAPKGNVPAGTDVVYSILIEKELIGRPWRWILWHRVAPFAILLGVIGFAIYTFATEGAPFRRRIPSFRRSRGS